ncbi:ectoine hydroxylase-related dioxygenase (phytanoyl-CoA dioxygenase family) [Catenulispora sp. GP43]|uniref:phytanoyl-CoA dioxygenase family protein n=1 Tax=Catenulispora sp. GP43 TaxID=3156263 RepID=UPI0035187E40
MFETDLAVATETELHAAADSLRRDGLVVARNAVPPESIDEFRRQLCARMDPDADAGAGAAAAAAELTWTRLREQMSSQVLLRMRREAYECPQYAGVFRSPRLLGFLRIVLDTEEPFLHPRRWIRTNAAGRDAGAQPMHQDYWFVHGDPDVYTVWVPLHDCTEGGVVLVEGSHRDGTLAVDDKAAGKGAVAQVDRDRMVEPRLALGDVVVFHSLTVHGTAPDAPALARISIDGRFQNPTSPIAMDQLFPAMATEDGKPIARAGASGDDVGEWSGDPDLRVDPAMPIVTPRGTVVRG